MYMLASSPSTEFGAEAQKLIDENCDGCSAASECEPGSDDEHATSLTMTSSLDGNELSPPGRTKSGQLPDFAYDAHRRCIVISFAEVVEHDLIETFAKNKLGCKFLQNNFPVRVQAKNRLYTALMQKEDVFVKLSTDICGNFFAQCLVRNATNHATYYVWILKSLKGQYYPLCFHRCACRVVQCILENVPSAFIVDFFAELFHEDCLRLATDQHGCHVLMTMLNCFGIDQWAFVIHQLINTADDFFRVIEDKHGCRFVQAAIYRLSCEALQSYRSISCPGRLLQKLLECVLWDCKRTVTNEFSNYVVQEIIKSPSLALFRDQIIKQCLLGNLLSFSQEKFSSHVVELALQHAPPYLLAVMIDELFDGYVPDPKTNVECLDILLSHPYGNYVMQRLCCVCRKYFISMTMGESREAIGILGPDNLKSWTNRLRELIFTNRTTLSKRTSGKRLISIMQSF